MKILNTLLATGALVFAAGAASAATENWITNGTQCVANGEFSDINPDAVKCVGFFDVKNDSANDSINPDDAKDGFIDVNLDEFDGVEGLFGYTDWDYFFKYESATASGEGYRGDGDFTLSDMLSGKYGQIAIAFKQGGANSGGPDKVESDSEDNFGSEWAAYLYNSPFPEMGSYSLARFTNTGLSHMTIWGRGEPVVCEGDDCVTTYIPLPAAGWLLLGGLGGLAALRRRNKV